MLQVLEQLGDTLGERHWMYSAALCSTAALHEARGEYTQAISLLEAALELRRQLFSNSSFLYADTAALLAKTLMQQHTAAAAAAAAAAAGSSGSSGGGWFGRAGKESGKAAVSADVSRAIGLWQQAIKIVEDSGGVTVGVGGGGGAELGGGESRLTGKQGFCMREKPVLLNPCHLMWVGPLACGSRP